MIANFQDVGCDGEPDTCYFWHYDANGHLTAEGRDLGCDGMSDEECVEWTHDTEGNVTYGQFFELCGEEPTWCAIATYDDGGHFTGETRDNDCNGTGGGPCFIWTADGSGQVIASGFDADCNGTAELECEAWEYDERGRPSRFERDFDCNGAPDEDCSIWTYEPSWRPLPPELSCDASVKPGCIVIPNATREQVDTDCNGSADECRRLFYDADGYPLRVESDVGCDGLPDSCVSWAYEPA